MPSKKKPKDLKTVKKIVGKIRERHPKQGAMFRRRLALEEVVKPLAYREKSLGQEITKEISTLLWGGETSKRVQAVKTLGFLDKKYARKILPAFALGLVDYSTRVREMAALSLYQVSLKKAEPWLVRALNDPEPKVRLAVVNAFSTCGTKKSVPALIKAFETEKNNKVKESIIHTLPLFRDRRTVKPITQYLRTAKKLDIATQVVLLNALDSLSPMRVCPIVLRLLNHRSGKTRMAAADYMGLMSFKMAKGKPNLKKRLETAKTEFARLSTDKQGILLYAIALNKIPQSQIPIDWEKAESKQKRYLINLKKQAQENSLDQILEVFGLRKPKKKKKKRKKK